MCYYRYDWIVLYMYSEIFWWLCILEKNFILFFFIELVVLKSIIVFNIVNMFKINSKIVDIVFSLGEIIIIEK